MVRPMTGAALAGIAYVAIVLAAGFVLGVARTLLLSPRLGELASVALELPVMLAVSWLAARRLIAARGVAAAIPHRLAMGGIAFLILMMAEAGISVFGIGRTLAQHLAAYRSPAALLGLAGQIVFALLPAILLLTHPPRR